VDILPNIWKGTLYVNRGRNGFSESYHLYGKFLHKARERFAKVVDARSLVLARGCTIIGAGVRHMVRPLSQQLILPAPLASLLKPDGSPYWDYVHADAVGLDFSLETSLGRWVPRIFRGIPDDEMSGGIWVRRGLVVPPGPAVRPLDPGSATKDELWRYFLATVRDETIYARQLPTNDFWGTLWETDIWDALVHTGVGKRDIGRKFQGVSWEAGTPSVAPRFSPCGEIVGYVRSAYVAPCIFYSQGVASVLRWYFAQPDALVFPLETIFHPYSQELEYANTNDVGEYTGKSNRAWRVGTSYGNAPGNHYSGTQADFMGLTVTPWSPPQPTPLDQRPECDMPVQGVIRVSNVPETVNELLTEWISFDATFFTLTNPAAGHVHITMPPPPPPSPPVATLSVESTYTPLTVPDVALFVFEERDLFSFTNPAAGEVRVSLGGGESAALSVLNNETALAIPNHRLVPVSCTGDNTLRGIAGGFPGRELSLVNVGGFSITLTDDDPAAPAANRMKLLADAAVPLHAGKCLDLVYSTAADGWQVKNQVRTTSDIPAGLRSTLVRYAAGPGPVFPSEVLCLSTLSSDEHTAWVERAFVTEQGITSVLGDQTLDVQNTAFLYLPASGPLSGATEGIHGQQVLLVNVGALPITLEHNSGPVAGRRFYSPTGADFVVEVGYSVRIVYASILGYGNRWLIELSCPCDAPSPPPPPPPEGSGSGSDGSGSDGSGSEGSGSDGSGSEGSGSEGSGSGSEGSGSGSGSGIGSDGLLAYWKLEEASTTRFDETVNSLDLTHTGTELGNTPGILGNACLFGTDQHLFNLGAEFDMAGQDFSILGWFRLAAMPPPGEYRTICYNTKYVLRVHENAGNPSIEFIVSDSFGVTVNVTGIAAATVYCFMARRNNANGQIDLRIDAGTPDIDTATIGSSSNFIIGHPTHAQSWNGWIDAVAFFTRLVSDAEYSAFYNGGAGLEYPW
jgi:hypothetical protein